jgi:small subunit ribosomal protein S11
MAKAPAKNTKKKSFKKKEKKHIPVGVMHVQATFNNTIITFTDPIGNVVSVVELGLARLPGSRKGTPFAAQQASLTAANKAKEAGMRSVEVKVAGPGSVANRPCARCPPSVSKFAPFVTRRRFRTMAADPPKRRRV